MWGRPVAVLSVAWSGELAEGEQALAPLPAEDPPLLDLVGPMPYVALQSMLDATAPHGDRFYDRLHYLERVSDQLIDALVAGFESVPTPEAHIITGRLGGAVQRVPAGATAFGHREAGAEVWFIGAAGQAPVGPTRDWVRRVSASIAPYVAGGTYVNALERARRSATPTTATSLPASSPSSTATTPRACSPATASARERSGRWA